VKKARDSLNEWGISKQDLYEYFSQKEYLHITSEDSKKIIKRDLLIQKLSTFPEFDVEELDVPVSDQNIHASMCWNILEYFDII
jgi:hypothetical protein